MQCDDVPPVHLDGNPARLRGFRHVGPPDLTRETAALFVRFHGCAITGPEGRHLVLSSVDDIEWRQEPEPELRKAIAGAVRPPEVIEGSPEESLTVEASVLYGRTLSKVVFRIRPKGLVEDLHEEPLFERLAVIPDAARLPFIGRFDAEGGFRSIRPAAVPSP